MRRTALLGSSLSVIGLLVAAQAAPSMAAASTRPGIRHQPAVVQVSSDPYSNSGAEHATEVEPDTIANGQSVMSVFQTGRISSGCSDDQGWAFSSDGGKTWSHGFMPDLTPSSSPPGPFASVSDPVVTWDGKYKEWVASRLDCSTPFSVSVSTSSNGTTWSNPVTVASGASFDKDWVTCDSTASSPSYGNCYTEWDLPNSNDLVDMSTSTDGGKTWAKPVHTASSLHGIGGEPIVLPSGTVVVPILNNSNALVDFTSTNGGTSWGTTHTITAVQQAAFAGGIRGPFFPDVSIDGGGKLYVTWPDCRFRTGCSRNDMVLTTSTSGTSWTAVTRVPTSPLTGVASAMGGGVGVDPTSSGSTARLGLYYYYYSNGSCTTSTCQLFVGFDSSTDSGSTWSAPVTVAGPMKLTQLASASGHMVGDYVGAAAIPGGNAFAAFAVGAAPTGGKKYNEAMYDASGGEPATGGTHRALPGPVRGTLPARYPAIAR